MEANSMRRPAPTGVGRLHVDWDVVVTWVLCFGLVAYLGIDGGGFDPLLYNQVGLGIWWILLIGTLVAALPRLTLSPLAITAFALLTAFLLWTALSLVWTESSERTMVDVARVLSYLGIFALLLGTRAPREVQRLVGAVAAAIVLIVLLALLSRLHPAWFPSADQTAQFIRDSRERLSYPLNYWNALGALVSIGVPLVLHLSWSTRSTLLRAAAAAALPPMALTLFFTLSRGGIVATVIGLALYFAITEDRAPKLLTVAIGAVGSGVLIGVAASHEALKQGLGNSAAHSQGNEVLVIGIVVMAIVALLQALVVRGVDGGRRPGWTYLTRRQTGVVLAGLLVLVVIGGLAAHAPRRISHAAHEFTGGAQAGYGTNRLGSFAGESRFALWKSAVHENATDPLIGTGSGTFEYWWDRDAAGTEAVRDAHSLYLQTLGELGIVGLAILVAFLVAVLGFGTRAIARTDGAERSALAAALAGVLAFFVTAAVDWSWQMPVLVAAMLILASAVVMTEAAPLAEGVPRSIPPRIAFALFAVAAIVAIAIPLAATSLVHSSASEVRSGDLSSALKDARSAQNVEPYAATPRLQEALVLELMGNLPEAASAAHEATERESTNWRTWLVLSRIEAERGRAKPSVAAYVKAKSLDPLSPLFAR
jgi:O-antigen ligase